MKYMEITNKHSVSLKTSVQKALILCGMRAFLHNRLKTMKKTIHFWVFLQEKFHPKLRRISQKIHFFLCITAIFSAFRLFVQKHLDSDWEFCYNLLESETRTENVYTDSAQSQPCSEKFSRNIAQHKNRKLKKNWSGK